LRPILHNSCTTRRRLPLRRLPAGKPFAPVADLSPSSDLSYSSRVGRSATWLNRFAWLTCVATLLLICSGGMVTSKNVGLAVPDWPTTFGYNMFLFPISKWVGGILFEHTHRLM